jgi:branched-chain amino acid transport system substrate-binding protein
MPDKENAVRPVWKKIFRVLIKFVVLPIVSSVVAIVIVSRITNWWRGPDTYKIHVVSDFDDDLAKNIRDEFLKKFGSDLKINGIKVEADSIKCGLNDVKRVSGKLAKAKDTLMVVGHFYSSHSEAALPNYLEATPSIPVILTTETNPRIVPEEFTKGNCPIFRLSPTDNQQAETAAKFAIESAKCSTFWVVQDTENPVYSQYLSQEFADNVQRMNKKVVLRTDTLTAPSSEICNALKIDCVFFAGQWTNALILVRQIRALWLGKPMPKIILSDWAVSRNLTSQGGDDMEGVYLTHQLNADQYIKYGYSLYGGDAASIVRELVYDANDLFPTKVKERGFVLYLLKYLLNVKRVKDARFVLNSVMHSAVVSPLRKFKIKETKEEYVFRGDAVRENAKFHIWQVRNQTFKEVD